LDAIKDRVAGFKQRGLLAREDNRALLPEIREIFQPVLKILGSALLPSPSGYLPYFSWKKSAEKSLNLYSDLKRSGCAAR